VDSAGQGPGVFFRLRSLFLGASVLVRFGDGSRERFRVIARHAYRKSMLPKALFARSGRPMLLLITCGGPFDPVTHRYEDNVVVYAESWT
jgi:hypothetical protein